MDFSIHKFFTFLSFNFSFFFLLLYFGYVKANSMYASKIVRTHFIYVYMRIYGYLLILLPSLTHNSMYIYEHIYTDCEWRCFMVRGLLMTGLMVTRYDALLVVHNSYIYIWMEGFSTSFWHNQMMNGLAKGFAHAQHLCRLHMVYFSMELLEWSLFDGDAFVRAPLGENWRLLSVVTTI